MDGRVLALILMRSVRAGTRLGRSPVVRLALLMAVVLVGALPVADAATRKASTPRSQASKAETARRPGALTVAQAARSRVRTQQVKVASRVNALKSTNAKVTRSLRILTANVRDQSVQLAHARKSASAAATQAESARARERATAATLDELKSARVRVALDAYLRPNSQDLSTLFDSKTLGSASRRQVLGEVATKQSVDVLDRLNALEEDLLIERRNADAAEARARKRRGEVASRLSSLQTATKQQSRLAAQSEDRLEAALAESAALSTLDKRLSGKIAAENRALAAALARAQLRRGRGGGNANVGGSVNLPVDIPTGSTNGITVASRIRGKLAALIATAARDGIVFSGGGYRSSRAQVQLRAAHCGNSTYGIYQAPASSCRPPTARPGRSMHEQGLAVDFQQGGRTLTRGSSGYRWLRANGAKYGFFNLPSEPWHWSVNGR